MRRKKKHAGRYVKFHHGTPAARLTGALLILYLTVSLTVSLAACGQTETKVVDNDPYTIGVVTKSGDSEYWMSVLSGMQDAADDYGVELIAVSPDVETNTAMQEKLIEDLIHRQVDALAISPLVSDETAYLDLAEEAQIPIIAYDTAISDENVPYIGIDNVQAGENLAEEAVKLLNGEGTVGIVTGDIRQASHKERLEGFQSYLDAYEEINIAFTENGYSNLQMSEQDMEQLLEAWPDLDLIFATSAVTALGWMDYLQAIGRNDIRILTVDAQNDALAAVEEGTIAALAAQSGYDVGYAAIRYLADAREDANLFGEDVILDAQIVTAENVKSWIKDEG